MFLSPAVRYAPDNSDCIWQRSHLYEQLGEHKKALEGYQLILKLLPDDDGEKYLQLARNITKVTGPDCCQLYIQEK